MRKIIVGLMVLAVVVVAIGFNRGWFTLSSSKQGADDNVNLHVDRDKMKEDAQTVKQKATDLRHKAAEKVNERDVPVKAGPTSNRP